MSADRRYLCCRLPPHTCAFIVLLLTLGVDPAFAQSSGISWGAVGVSWALSTLTTCILLYAAFAIRSCVKHSRDAKTPDNEGDDEELGERNAVVGSRDATGFERHPMTSSLDRQTSALLSVSQQSAYVRAQNEGGKKRKKSKPLRGATQHDPSNYVEQWCEDQAKRGSVVAALQNINDGGVPNANHRDVHSSRYPAGLDLPSTNIGHNHVNRQADSPPQTRTVPERLPTVELQHEAKKPTDQNVGKIAAAVEPKQTVRKSGFQIPVQQSAEHRKTVAKEQDFSSAAVPPPSATQPYSSNARMLEEVGSSPVRVRKTPKENQNQIPRSGAKANVLEFKRPPGEVTPVRKQVATGSQVQKVATGSRKKVAAVEESTTSSTEEEDEEEDEEEEEETEEEEQVHLTQKTKDRPVNDQREVAKRSTVSKVQNESPAATNKPKTSTTPAVESTPPNPARHTSSRNVQRRAKPLLLNTVPIPAEGISPPPGLLPLTAATQVTKRQAVIPQVPKENQSFAKNEQNVEKRKRKSKVPPQSLDLRTKRASTGSDVVFFAPELQGTSTPAMRPKSAFTPVASSRLSRDMDDDDDDDDDDEPAQGVSSLKRGAVAPFLISQKSEKSSQGQQFHGLLSDRGLQELAEGVDGQWNLLADNLRVPKDRQEYLAEKFAKNTTQCAFEMLRDWRERHSGSKVDIRSTLCNALVAINRPEIAEQLVQEDMIGSSEKLDNKKLVSVV